MANVGDVKQENGKYYKYQHVSGSPRGGDLVMDWVEIPSPEGYKEVESKISTLEKINNPTGPAATPLPMTFKRPDPRTFRISPLEAGQPLTAGTTGMEDQYRYRVNDALNRRLNRVNVPTYQYSNMEMPSVPRSAWDRAIERRKSNGAAMPPRGF